MSANGEASGYSDEPKPLAAYALLVGVFGAGFGGALGAGARHGRLPERIGLRDIILVGVATHKAARLIAKDTVTSFLRSPFVRYEGPGSANELEESPRGQGLRRAIGELLVCPPCVGLWVASSLITGLVRAPRATRALAVTLTAYTLSDFLHQAYVGVQKRA